MLFVILLMSVTLVVVPPSQPAYACEQVASAVASVKKYWDSSIGKLLKFVNQMKNYIEDTFLKAQFEMVERLGEFDQNVREAIGKDFWQAYYPDMKKQTEQLHVAEIDQSRVRCSFMDAENLTNSQRDIKTQETEAHRRFRIDSEACQAESMKKTLTETEEVSKNVAKALSVGERYRVGGKTGSISADGPEREANIIYNDANTNFCIAGQKGCAASGPNPMGHILNANLTSGAKMSVDLSVPQNRVMVEKALANFTTPASPPQMPVDVMQNTEIMKEVIFKRQPMLARKSLLNYVMGRDLGDAVAGPPNMQVTATRVDSDINVARASTNPSHNEIMEAMRERLLSRAFMRSMIVEPEDLLRRMATMKEQQMRTWLKIKDTNEKRLALLALLLGQELDNDRLRNASEMRNKPR